MRQDWTQWEPRRRQQTDGIVPDNYSLPPQQDTMGGPSVAGYGAMAAPTGSPWNPMELSPYADPGMAQYGNPSAQASYMPEFGLAQPYNPTGGIVPPGYGNPTGGIVPPNYGSQATGQPSSGYYENPGLSMYGQSLSGQPQSNQWAAMGRQSSVQQPQMNNWWSGRR